MPSITVKILGESRNVFFEMILILRFSNTKMNHTRKKIYMKNFVLYFNSLIREVLKELFIWRPVYRLRENWDTKVDKKLG